MVNMIPRNLSAALATAMTEKVGEYKNASSTDNNECPFLTALLARKEFHFVLEFCTYSDLYALLVVGKQSQLPYLRHVCRTKLVRLVQALMHTAIWNDLENLQALLVRYQVPPNVVAGSVRYGSLTPLAGSAMRGNYRACALLLQWGATVHWADERHVTALEMAMTRLRHQGDLSPLDNDDGAGCNLWKTIVLLKRHGGRVYVASPQESSRDDTEED